MAGGNIPLLLLLGTVLLCSSRSAAETKYNLTRAVESSLVMSHAHPDDTSCTVPGVCVPVNQTIPARSMWYWCGLASTHRTVYTITSRSTNNLTTMFLMRQDELEGCALANVTRVGDDCKMIPESSCGSRKTCDIRVYGLVFPDPTCFVIINNRGSDIIATVQVYNFYDSPRYYGTVFTLFFTIVGGLAIVANVTYQFYHIILAPVGKHSEPIKVKRASAMARDEEREAAAQLGMALNPDGGERPEKKAGLYGKIVGALKEKLQPSGSKHQA
ncbi:hypothetical protein CHLRE_01g038200v5 [Chlamydomonas reinhardtii]|uniref:Uncharacterized protein n=1 Tax=Chlamydomonas reinhardtii TaxID=3055 RepID=A0A2K3E767_CHLRE|nr:uncharacterized protein CHLRE_01g038200v5 [Chlamydomonas reinhardtii]PNW88638.1 hypothetical protein CHLRE_01g038200v5 [Chlamydomonas reinhardtii]